MNQNNESTSQPETRESKRALQLKSEMMGILSDLVEVMEEARKEGFDTAFNVPRNEKGENYITGDFLKITKSW